MTNVPPPFPDGPANGSPGTGSTEAARHEALRVGVDAVPQSVRHVPPPNAARRRQLTLGLAGLGLLAVLLIALVARNRDGVSGARHDLKESADVVRDKEREVARAQQELEARLADLQAARAQVQANAVKLNAEATKEQRDARDTMVVGGEVVAPGDAERRANETLERSRAAVGTPRR